MQKIILITFLAALMACNTKDKKEAYRQATDTEKALPYPETLTKAFEAHGGLETWQKYSALSFDNVSANGQREHQIVNLKNRKVRIDRDSVQIGFDGQEVWVAPNLEAFGKGSPRFYHNLYFYFFGMPFLFADPGINYEDLGLQTIDSTTYHAIKITFDQGVGDSDSDIYIPHFDPETHRLKLLLYTVTFFSGKSTDKYNAIMYSDWQETDGLVVPKTFKGYIYNNGTLGKERYRTDFEQVAFGETPPDNQLFDIPELAEIDSVKNN